MKNEKLITAYTRFQDASSRLFKAQNDLWDNGDGFFDQILLSKLAEANLEWKRAANHYHGLLSFYKKMNLL